MTIRHYPLALNPTITKDLPNQARIFPKTEQIKLRDPHYENPLYILGIKVLTRAKPDFNLSMHRL